MNDALPQPADLAGTVDERQRLLASLPAESLSARWLRRQLDNALSAWAATETAFDISEDARVDY
ncbi:hypothetical protein JNB62_00735 [Microbacterium jejuense]|uniref:Uncharacterized protein n=1 Tax=Microbacterium jejuense TaxID=1263637 RepID=A0ABS7HHK2_9MICO|nr:hypothetical protein [Microbacterium jejuense]MBW9092203.1 hypothetical protein [Microbacterium jejuense]